jgi:cytochrome c oxidase subunit 2
VQRWWSVLFGVVLAASLGLFIAAPLVEGWWLPHYVSSFSKDIDDLFYVILLFTGFFFVLTEGLLVYIMWRYAYRPGEKATYVEGNHRLEVAWTIVPAAILLFIAVAQIRAWERIKYAARMPAPDQVVQVTARQWEWRFRHPADVDRFTVADKEAREQDRRHWAEKPEIDDFYVPQELHTWKDANIKLYLQTGDVLHSFFLPHLRIKQDALPGKTIPLWFKAIEANTRFDPLTGTCEKPMGDKEWELACAELCGGGHYRMRGQIYVHPSKEDYEAWHKHTLNNQHSYRPTRGVAPSTGSTKK